jgi:hypothetical protein
MGRLLAAFSHQKQKGMAVEQQQIINILFGVAGFCVAWWVNAIWGMVKSQQDQISQLNIKLAEGYMPRQESDKNFTRIYEALDDIRKEVGHMSRNQASQKVLADAIGNLRG